MCKVGKTQGDALLIGKLFFMLHCLLLASEFLAAMLHDMLALPYVELTSAVQLIHWGRCIPSPCEPCTQIIV